MTEVAARATLRDHLSSFGKLQRFENLTGAGVLDTYYRLTHPRTGAHGAGWIESKYLDEWPARTSTPVRLLLRKEQIIWAEEWSTAGERVVLYLRAPDAHILLDASLFSPIARRIITRSDLREHALVYVEERKFPTERFLTALTSPWPPL